MNEQRIKELFNDEVFADRLLATESAEAAQALFKEKDVDVSIDELNSFREFVVNNADKIGENGELPVEVLDDVAGGFILSGVLALTALGMKAGKAKTAVSAASAVSGIVSGVVQTIFSRW